MTLEELRAFKPQIMELAAQYGVENIRVFGSVARGEAGEDSDVDLMVEGFCGSLLTFVQLKNRISDVIGIPVDMFKPQNIRHPLVRQRVESDAVPL